MTDDKLFDEKTRRKLDQLMLVATRVRAGAMKGERRSIKRGTSIEFADYRNYVRGDDLRRLDWNIYARLEKPFIKLLEDEEDLAVHLLLDSSRSMDWPGDGERDQHKFFYGQRLMAGLATIAMGSNDRLTLATLNDSRQAGFGPVRGRGHSLGVLRYVSALKPDGTADLNTTLRDYALRAGRPGLCFLISDLLAPAGFMEGLSVLQGKGYEVAILHLLARDEVEPPMGGDLRLIDIETNQPQEVSIDGGMRDLYMKRLTEWQDSIRIDCLRRGVHYVPVITDTPWEKVILYNLRRLGTVK
ncbi:MAG TPA: DUF58 domain-containing protein [Aggregatilineales bacterium]|nr:DUF58 domain-containing protein [Aggregatilineales bacterium]